MAEQTPQRADQNALNKKIVAIIVVAIVVLCSVLLTWYIYYRHWSIKEVAEQVINDPTEASPGFKHSLAGKTIVVDGKVTNMTTIETTLGNLTYIELDGFDLLNLMVWESVPYHIGQRISMDVEFEWSMCNDERHVYSPQISFPTLQVIIPMDFVLRAVNFVSGVMELTPATSYGNDITISVDWVKDPIPLSSANCSLRAGRFSWAVEYIDVLGGWRYGNETDFIANLTSSDGVNGTIHFTDRNGDRFLDKGDTFVLRNLTRPDTASGVKTYMFMVSFQTEPEMRKPENPGAQCYLIMAKNGLVRAFHDPQIVEARLLRSSIPNGVKYTCEIVDPVVNWSDVEILLRDASDFGYEMVNWTFSSSELEGTSSLTKSFPAEALGSSSVFCNVTDVLGNGQLDRNDRFTLEWGGNSTFTNDNRYVVTVLYSRTHSSMCSETFLPNTTPTSNMSLTNAIPGFWELMFGPTHIGYNDSYRSFDVPWSELTIRLSDGTNNSTWSPTTDALSGSGYMTTNYSAAPMGTLTVYCTVFDREGNGYVNRGDTILLSTGGSERFHIDTNYTVTLVFEPTGGEIFDGTFRG